MTTCSFNDSDIRGLTAASGKSINSTLGTQIDFNNFYGASRSRRTNNSSNTGTTKFERFNILNFDNRLLEDILKIGFSILTVLVL